MEENTMALQDLQNAVADLTAASEAEHAELAEVVSELQTAEGQITQLQTQVEQGGGVSAADLDAVTSTIASVAQKAQAAVEAAKAAAVSPAAPAGGGSTPDPVPDPTNPTAPVTDPTVPDPTVPDPAVPDPSVPAPDPTAPAEQRSEYVFGGDPSTVDSTVWPSSGNETAEPQPQPLFFYSGDEQNADGSWTTNGDNVGGIWHLYTGPTQPAGAATSGTGEA